MALMLSELFCFIKAVLIIPVIVVLLTPLLIWKNVVKILAKFFKPNLTSMLDLKETFFVLTEVSIYRNPKMVNCIFLKLKGWLTIEYIKLQIYQTVVNKRKKTEQSELMYGQLQQHPIKWLGYMFYEWDTNFDISHHVRIVENLNVKSNLYEIVADRLKIPFYENSSLWDISFLQNLGENSDTSLIIFRMHHSLCDGFSLLKLIVNSLMSVENRSLSVFIPKKFEKTEAGRVQTCYKKIKEIYKSTIGLPFALVENMNAAIQNDVKSLWQIRSNGLPAQAHALFTSTGKISLQDLDIAKRKLKIPFTSILNTVYSNVLHNYFQRTQRNFRKIRLSETFKIWHLFPFDKHPDYKLKNCFGSTGLSISSSSEKLPEQLKFAKEDYNSSRNFTAYSVQLANHYIYQVTNCLPSSLYIKFLGASIGTIATITNMAGPGPYTIELQSQPVTLWNNRVEDILFTISPSLQTGIIFSVISFNGFIKVGVCADSNCVDSLDELNRIASDIETELENIFQLSNANSKVHQKLSDKNSYSSSETIAAVWV